MCREKGYLLPTWVPKKKKKNLPTFQLNAPVIIRPKMKKVRTNVAIYSHTLLRLHIIGGQRSVKIAPPSLLHHSGSATRDFQSSISVEALLRGYHLDAWAGSSSTAPVLCHGPVQLSPPWQVDHGRGQELFVKEVLHILMIPTEEHFNWYGGLPVPGCWIAMMRRQGGRSNPHQPLISNDVYPQ